MDKYEKYANWVRVCSCYYEGDKRESKLYMISKKKKRVR